MLYPKGRIDTGIWHLTRKGHGQQFRAPSAGAWAIWSASPERLHMLPVSYSHYARRATRSKVMTERRTCKLFARA